MKKQMKGKSVNQKSQNLIKNDPINRTNAAVRRLLASSALSTAIVSWIATAQGLHMYVFSYYWQAAIISAAIQGTLFSFSIKAIPLMKRLKTRGKIAMLILWICILFSSSIFSYVYIAKTVYSNELLKKDSNRIMATQCIEIYFLLDEIIDWKTGELEDGMTDYIKLLATDDGGIELTDIDKQDLEIIKADLKNTVSDNFILLLDKIQSGFYTDNDIQTLNDMLDNEKNSNNVEIEDIKEEIKRKGDDNLQKEERLKSFRDTDSPEYKNLNEESKNLQEEIDNLDERLSDLRQYSKKLENCQSKITHINNGLERELYNTTLNLRKYLNQDEIDAENLIAEIEKVYEDLFRFNTPSNDLRLMGYRDFRNGALSYANLVEKKETINTDRKNVYEIISDDKSISIDEEEENDWDIIFSDLQDILKDMPQTYFDEFMKNTQKDNLKYNSTNEILELIMEMDRLYLSDLNDFERTWTLLFSDIHIYKTLLWFSVIFAFGIDLFSFGTGLLLYFLDNKEKGDESNGRENPNGCIKCIFNIFFHRHLPGNNLEEEIIDKHGGL